MGRLIFTYEKSYPNDTIDEFILNSVRNIYPDAGMRSSLMMFNTEQEYYQRILPKMLKEEFQIQVNPRFDDISQIIKSGKNEWPGFFMSLDLFCYPNEKTVFQDSLSIGEYDIDKEIEFKGFWERLINQVESISI